MKSKGIEFTIGRPKGKRTTEVQSVLFALPGWTPQAARAWLESRGFSDNGIDKTAKHLHFRQRMPGAFTPGSFRTIAAGRKGNPGFLSRLFSPDYYTDSTDLKRGTTTTRVGKRTRTQYHSDLVPRTRPLTTKLQAARGHCASGSPGAPESYKQALQRACAKVERLEAKGGAEYQAALRQYAALEARAQKAKRNPDTETVQAESLYRKFHGKAASGSRLAHVRSHTDAPRNAVSLGELTEITLSSGSVLGFDGRGFTLTSDAAGNNLQIIGDATFPSAELENYDTTKDLIDFGEIKYIVYRSKKAFDNFVKYEYKHKLGEESGDRPTLTFDRVNRRLLIVGGRYRVKPEGIVD